MEFNKLRKIYWLLPLLLILAAPARCPASSSQAMIEPHAQAMPLLPFLDYLIDQSMDMDIEEAARAGGWQPFVPDRLPRQEGIIWLRFTIAPLASDARAQTFLLDIGQSVPGEPVMYVPFRNELSGAQEWREELPASRNILLLPEAADEAIPCYIRLDGLPGPWFSPMVRTPQNAASNWGSLAQTGAILALAVIMFICLLRGASEKGQWRYWTALFVAVALLQALLGMPAVSGSFNIVEIAAVLSPGIALMLMPHVGRHLMQTKKHSRSIDVQLFLLGFAGAALALLPLVPGWNWLYRWLELWPVAAVIFVPTALGAWLLAIPGARRFLLACLIPPACVACSLLGLDFGLPANVLASGPTWGIAVAALLLAATRAPSSVQEPEKKEAPATAVRKPLPALELDREGPATPASKPMPDLELEDDEEEGVINLEHPLDDPNLRLIPPKKHQIFPQPAPMPEPEQTPEAPISAPAPAGNLEARENALREPLDTILREGAALGKCSLPASARQYAENMIAASRELAEVLSKPDLPAQPPQEKAQASFNLQRIMRNAHDSVAAGAEYSGIALSWYMPPHLEQLYKGDALSLETTLTMLLESSVRSAHHGAIKLSVKRVPDSSDPGHLLFTVTDDGNGYPPLDRSSLALAKAWELTGEYGGYLSVECSQHGATIAFTAHFTPVEEDYANAEEDAGPHILLICADSEERRRLSRIIETLPCILDEAEGAPEAIVSQTQNPAALVICAGQFARPAAADMIRQLSRIARQAGIKCQALALTANENEWALLKASGFTHAMLEPVDPDVLRRTVTELTEDEKPTAPPRLPEKEDKTPSMLIDQSFPIATIFEGPDWLGSQNDGAARQASQTPASVAELGEEPVAKPASPAKEATTNAQPRPAQAASEAAEWVGEPMPITKPASLAREANANAQARPDQAASEAVEWVGEPMPITKPAGPAGEANANLQPRATQTVPEAVEWVGEPMPIAKSGSQPKGPENADQPEQKEGELLDFIVGVSGKQASPVRDFVKGSANMVASTLSNMLNRKESSEPEEEPIKARSDPAIIALLERMDAAMRHANAAFAAKNSPAIAESTGMIAGDAEKFGLRLLARMAKCVERAATANDMAALADLLPELAIAVERNRITLAQRKQD